jgi:hypothetical protein
MSNLRGQVRKAIETFVANHQDSQSPADILRVIQEEAMLMKETEDVRDALTSDPYEQFEQLSEKTLERFKRSLQVTSCDRVRCGSDYARIHAVVTFQSSSNNTMELNFLYERQPRRGMPPGENGDYPSQISYIIELSFNNGPRERLLEVQVWSASNVPSTEPAVCIQNDVDQQEDEEDGWEDMGSHEEDEDARNEGGGDNGMHARSSKGKEGKKGAVSTSTPEKTSDDISNFSPDTTQATKRRKTGSQANEDIDTDEGDEGGDGKQALEDNIDNHDQYIAFLDPDVLQSFADAARLLPINDGTAFFLIMTFPFFEHEWDIVGFVLEQFFGSDSDDEDDDAQ